MNKFRLDSVGMKLKIQRKEITTLNLIFSVMKATMNHKWYTAGSIIQILISRLKSQKRLDLYGHQII